MWGRNRRIFTLKKGDERKSIRNLLWIKKNKISKVMGNSETERIKRESRNQSKEKKKKKPDWYLASMIKKRDDTNTIINAMRK